MEDGLQRKRRWAMDGTWARICDALRIDCDVAEGREWTVSVDTSPGTPHRVNVPTAPVSSK
ncbi:hypothetical protein [Dactylosporangium darangshiense]|uniref:Transposase n=1 Tax=Dactylosporangium darangshiense TaxID=579108 RepID=A0ABP8DU26_9ACTN